MTSDDEQQRAAHAPGAGTSHTKASGNGTGAPTPVTYAAAGVDTRAGDQAVELMKQAVRATHTDEVLGGVGAFAGMVDASALKGYQRPLLATSTDGVGTKVAIAQAMDVHHTIGFDLVGMVVDDIAVVGATPLFMTDYIACGLVVPERVAAIVRGIARACAQAGTPLVGGETAEHPGLLAPDAYDLAGAATGVVEADEVLGPDRVRPGDVVVGMASSGLHANGYSLVRAVVDRAGWELDRHVPEFARSLGAELLEPTRIYAPDILALAGHVGDALHAVSHITGGGLAANVARVLPAEVVATVDRSSWQVPPVFEVIRSLGAVPRADLEATLNLGVGMVAVVAPDGVEETLRLLSERGLPSWVLGEVRTHTDIDDGAGPVVRGTKGMHAGGVQLHGEYRTA